MGGGDPCHARRADRGGTHSDCTKGLAPTALCTPKPRLPLARRVSEADVGSWPCCVPGACTVQVAPGRQQEPRFLFPRGGYRGQGGAGSQEEATLLTAVCLRRAPKGTRTKGEGWPQGLGVGTGGLWQHLPSRPTHCGSDAPSSRPAGARDISPRTEQEGPAGSPGLDTAQRLKSARPVALAVTTGVPSLPVPT